MLTQVFVRMIVPSNSNDDFRAIAEGCATPMDDDGWVLLPFQIRVFFWKWV